MSIIIPANTLASGGFDVANSLRFNSGSSDSLTITPSSASNRKTWTWSSWVKRSILTSGDQSIFNSHTDAQNQLELYFNSDDSLYVTNRIGNTGANLRTNRKFRDPSAWIHIVLAVDTTQGTNTNRMKLYVNGVQETSLSEAGYPGQNTDTAVNNTVQHRIGDSNLETFFNGYIAEAVLIDGSALAPDQFGEFDEDSGIWKPIKVSSLTFGTNGFYLPFLANGTNAGFVDFSPNAYAVTTVGSTVHSFAQAKFNDASIYFDGSGDALSLADGNQWDFGTGDYTVEFWVNKAHTGKESVFETRGGGGNGFNVEFNSSNVLEWYDGSITGTLPVDGSAVTANTWVHFALVRASNVHKMYRNGTEVGTALTSSSSQVSVGGPNIGRRLESSTANDYTGYLDEIRLSTVARYTGNFTAPSAAFVSDSDTRLLIQSKASNLLGGDNSGQGNHFTTNNLTLVDQSIDTCTNNYCVMNPLDNFFSNATFSQGNLQYSSSRYASPTSTFGVTKGKWYFEIKCVSAAGTGGFVGITSATATATNFEFGNTGGGRAGYVYANNGGVYGNGGTSAGAGVFAEFGDDDNDLLMMAADLDNNKIYFGKNGTWGNSQNPVNGNNALTIVAISTQDSGVWRFGAMGETNNATVWQWNFGSPVHSIDSTQADDDGHGNFEYDVPAGYFALNSKNLAEYG